MQTKTPMFHEAHRGSVKTWGLVSLILYTCSEIPRGPTVSLAVSAHFVVGSFYKFSQYTSISFGRGFILFIHGFTSFEGEW